MKFRVCYSSSRNVSFHGKDEFEDGQYDSLLDEGMSMDDIEQMIWDDYGADYLNELVDVWIEVER